MLSLFVAVSHPIAWLNGVDLNVVMVWPDFVFQFHQDCGQGHDEG